MSAEGGVMCDTCGCGIDPDDEWDEYDSSYWPWADPRKRRATMAEASAAKADEDAEEGPWGVYDVYCLKCGKRAISVASVKTEAIDLWECPGCGAWALSHHLHEDVCDGPEDEG